MCIPASAALFLAALAALPSKGTDADNATSGNGSLTLNIEESRPTVNIFYQMLHTTNTDTTNINITITNSSKLPNKFTSTFNLFNVDIDSFKYSTSTLDNKKDECCITEDGVASNVASIDKLTRTVKLSEGGAKLDVRVKKRQGRRKRVISVVRTFYESNATKSVVSDEVTVTPLPTFVPVVAERRRKPGETGSSSPLLNYIFDTYSNTHQHQHRNDRAGNSNGIYTAAAPEIEALVGSTAQLDCKVDALHDKLVSWVRRKNDVEPMDLLTTGTQLYTADDRYSAKFIPPDIWRLEVRDVRPSDAANYDCQLSAHPPRTARVTLHVPEVSVRIIDGAGASVSDQVCEEGSTVALRCEVRGLRMEGGPALLWYRKDTLLNDDTTRGGISVRTEFGMNGANSVLRVARVRADDAGRYTCKVAKAPPVVLPPADVLLHVIKGESLAELHQSANVPSTSLLTILSSIIVIYAYLCKLLNQ